MSKKLMIKKSKSSDKLVDFIKSASIELQSKLKNKIVIQQNVAKLKLINDVTYTYKSYKVTGQEDACKLTAVSDLPAELKNIYLIDSGLTNIYSNKDTLLTGVQACIYCLENGYTPTVSGMSAMTFNTTRPETPTSQHNFGKAFDIKIQGKMMSDGTKYDAVGCGILALCLVSAGATRVFFADQAVIDAVNKATNKTVCKFDKDHKNHVHMDMR
jgi:hypothetical protein